MKTESFSEWLKKRGYNFSPFGDSKDGDPDTSELSKKMYDLLYEQYCEQEGEVENDRQ